MTGPYKVIAREANTVTIELANLEHEKVSRDRVVRAPITMDILIAESEKPESETPPTEVDAKSKPDSIYVNHSVELADILPPLTGGESHHDSGHTRFANYLRRVRKTETGTDTLDVKADSEPAISHEATNHLREIQKLMSVPM